MCCNGSKKAPPQLHAVASTWLSYVKLTMQQIFLRIAADLGLTVFCGNATDAYTHSLAPSDNYLAIDDAYADWYKDKFGEEVNRKKYYQLNIVYKVILNQGKCGCILDKSLSRKWVLKLLLMIVVSIKQFRTEKLSIY